MTATVMVAKIMMMISDGQPSSPLAATQAPVTLACVTAPSLDPQAPSQAQAQAQAQAAAPSLPA
eukprot:1476304-Rhodomonas_salina.1